MKNPSLKTAESTQKHFLAGGGEMGEIIRNYPWELSSLGEPKNWPASLKTTLGIVLHSAFPMFLFWGKELICFYNEAFRPSLGIDGKHPAIGKKGPEVWEEIWEFVGPLIDQVLKTGEPVYFEDQLVPFYRNGRMEEIYWTFSYSPAYGDNGNINGVFVTCMETTEKFIDRKQLQEYKNLLHFAVEAGELATWDYNPVTNRLSGNKRFVEWFALDEKKDFSLEEVLQSIKESDRANVVKAIDRSLQYESGGLYNVEYSLVTPWSERERFVHAKGRVWFNDEKVAYRFNGTLQDITDVKKTDVENQSLVTIIAASKEFIGLADPDGSIAYINPAALRMLGWDDINGRKISDSIYPPDLPQAEKYLAELLEKGSFVKEIRLFNSKANKPFWVQWNAFTIKDSETDRVIGFGTVSSDITERKKSELLLKESEERFQAAVAAVEGIVWTNTASGKMEGEQKGWSELTGQTMEEYQGYGWADAVHPDDAQQTIEAWREAVEQRKTFIFRHRVRTKQGEWRHFSVRAIPSINSEGQIQEWVGVHTDITEHLLAEEVIKESEERFRTLADRSPMIVYIVEPNSQATISYFNKTWLDYTGQTFEEALGRAWDGVVHPDDVQAVLDIYVPAFEKREAYTLPAIRLKRYDGEYRWFLFKGNPRYINNGEFIGYVGVGIDIHDQKMSEFALKQSEEILERLVKERTVQLERSNEDLQQFAHVASHDLKEPVRKIKMFTNRIREEVADRLTEREMNYIVKVQSAADRMSSMIDGVLLYSTINSAQQNIEEVDLQEILTDIQSDLEVIIHQKEAVIQVGFLPVIEGGAVLLYQLFYNLINNSLKFARGDQKLVVNIHSTKTMIGDQEYARIELKDNGIGFESSQASHIFNTFTRLNSKDQYEGTGLGLALCKKIVLRHNGTIEASGFPRGGATFTITLPLKQKRPTI